MLDRIFKLGKEAAVYGLSSIVGRFLNFLLVPVLTNYLSKGEYGVVSNVFAYIAFAFVLYGYGMDSAYMRFVSSADPADKKQTLSMPFYSLVVTSILFSLVVHFNAASIAGAIGVDPLQVNLIRYAGWILCFDTLVIVPFAYLRMENRARLFASLRLVNILINICLTVFLLVGLRMKEDAVFIANLAASAATAVFLIWIIVPQLTLRLSGRLFKDMLRFGLPYIPAGLAGIAIQVIDRPIVKALTNDDTLGVYQANYRLGVLMMLVVGMFDYAWRPFFLTHARDHDAPRLFSKVFTYFVALLMLVFVTGSLFVEDVIRIRFFGRYFIHPDFWGGLSIVPIILLSYVFTGAYVNFVVGIYLEKKTKFLPYITGAGALVNVVVNLTLIPKLGITGAALATLLSYMVMAIGIYFPSQRLYHVEYEWGRLARLALAAFAIVVPVLLLGLPPATAVGIAVKIVSTVLFVLLVFVLKVFDGADIKETRDALSKMFVRS
ncbi:MAG: oligosaccharide flippase family protein [Ignavibacteriales bacterium]|nr:oligosaccharide flippase family protein [Ignavibacteriales bacterium]